MAGYGAKAEGADCMKYVVMKTVYDSNGGSVWERTTDGIIYSDPAPARAFARIAAEQFSAWNKEYRLEQEGDGWAIFDKDSCRRRFTVHALCPVGLIGQVVMAINENPNAPHMAELLDLLLHSGIVDYNAEGVVAPVHVG